MLVRFHKQFEKDLAHFASPEKFQEIFAFVDLLEKAKSLHEIDGIKKLSGFQEFYRYRLGDYRIGFRATTDHIQLDRFLNRKDIYKKYP